MHELALMILLSAGMSLAEDGGSQAQVQESTKAHADGGSIVISGSQADDRNTSESAGHSLAGISLPESTKDNNLNIKIVQLPLDLEARKPNQIPLLIIERRVSDEKGGDWLPFFADIIKALAWPTAAIVLLFGFRTVLSQILPRMRLKYGDMELDFFREGMRKLEEDAAKADIRTEEPAVTGASATTPSPNEDYLTRLINVSPRAAVIEAFREVELAIEEAGVQVPATSTDRFVSPVTKLRLLHQRELIDRESLQVFERLRQLRNEAAHAREINLSADDALEYGRVALSLANRIREISRKQSK
jgi:hypothetical protein